ncbi:MAG: alanine racemase [Bacteroidales bacterium]|nr:alanine racemase [Bacteroidales bacterium]MCF8457813.1 alanine racemase [Bacteroidales bacterium]
MNNSSIITLNEKSVKNNIDFLKKKLGAKVKVSAVVKANAYGHGIEQIVPLFEKHGIDHYSVFYYSEAMRVYKSLSAPATIMIMGWVSDEDMNDVLCKGFEFFVFNLERLQTALESAKRLNIKAKIHLEAETGMNRSGLNPSVLNEAISIIKENPDYFDVVGFCTHLAGAESISNHPRIQKQLKKYQKMLSVLEANNIVPKCKHVANSAAAFVYPKARMDLVRVGIMMYGFWSSTEVFIQYINNKATKTDPLNRILGWQSQIMSIKYIKTGEFVSYGISYLAQSDIKTALIPIGYSSGYSRSLSNKGRVLIRGQRCSVIGVVNMNMIIADITNLPDAEIGDEVVIIGKQGDLEIKVSAFSDISEQLNYEVLAHLSESIKRTIINKL